MITALRTACTTAVVCCLLAFSAAAQEPSEQPADPGPPPANLSYFDGAVEVVHDGVAERVTAQSMLVDGDLVRTANGRAEVVFADGSLLHLDHDSEFELLSPTRLRLVAGRILMRVASASGGYVVDTHATSVRLDSRGEYGVASDAQALRFELTVARGLADLDDNGTRVVVRDGQMATITGIDGRVLLRAFNSARWDTFERWSNARVNALSLASSARYVPSELRPYAPLFDSYGRWDYMAPYGQVWFPAVDATWRPYYTGSWASTRYGWTWYGRDPWSWPTHHFGRWGFTGISWYWIPANIWAPAWVSWGFAPGFVSWCPLGWNGQPVLGFGPRAGFPFYDPWRAWTIIPRSHFGDRRVRVRPLNPLAIPESTRRAIVVETPPGSYAIARGSRTPSGRVPSSIDTAVPRDAFNAPRPGSVRRPYAPPAVGSTYPPLPLGSGAAERQPSTTPRTREGITSRDEMPDIRIFGGARNPRATPRVEPPPGGYPAAGYPVPRYPYTTPPTLQPPPGAVMRPGVPERRGRDGDSPVYAPPPGLSPRPQGEAVPRPGRMRDLNYAAPGDHAPAVQAPARERGAPPPPRTQGEGADSGSSSGASGGARRRPPQ